MLLSHDRRGYRVDQGRRLVKVGFAPQLLPAEHRCGEFFRDCGLFQFLSIWGGLTIQPQPRRQRGERHTPPVHLRPDRRQRHLHESQHLVFTLAVEPGHVAVLVVSIGCSGAEKPMDGKGLDGIELLHEVPVHLEQVDAALLADGGRRPDRGPRASQVKAALAGEPLHCGERVEESPRENLDVGAGSDRVEQLDWRGAKRGGDDGQLGRRDRLAIPALELRERHPPERDAELGAPIGQGLDGHLPLGAQSRYSLADLSRHLYGPVRVLFHERTIHTQRVT